MKISYYVVAGKNVIIRVSRSMTPFFVNLGTNRCFLCSFLLKLKNKIQLNTSEENVKRGMCLLPTKLPMFLPVSVLCVVVVFLKSGGCLVVQSVRRLPSVQILIPVSWDQSLIRLPA